ncbi:protein FAR1-RELATED SEQUENCE 1-like [Chenopodium quinoa]|uniref:protein FAR1-RELATED SEQUENCE 1-like n=1 Tax=Chenopodium quinoa TaxID=63459 RepID=UPI000B76C2EA|nr:protein FAR1-RELATED SEQUENCE 1-like [Chenopodium quinoa]
MWIPAYMKHLFWAGMKITQRSERLNSFFDMYVKSDTRLYQFAERYCDAMENRSNAEKEADANSARRLWHVITGFAFEKAFQKVYTDAKFVEVQEQCARLMYVSIVGKREVSNNVVEHLVQDRVWFYDKQLKKEIPMDRKRVYTVTFNSETSGASCECKLFECHGIMCRHQFKVFDDNWVKEVPSKYILRRWRKDVHRRHTRVKVAYHDPTKTEEVKRYDRIMVQFDGVCLKAATRPEYAKMVFEAICKLEKSLDAAILKESDKEGAAIEKGSVNAAKLKESDKGAESVGSEAATMESSPSVNMDLEGIGTVPPSDFAGSCMVSSALGLDDISIDPVVNTPAQAIVVANDDSSVNDNLTPASVQKPLSVGDPISRKKAHRPRAKRFIC